MLLTKIYKLLGEDKNILRLISGTVIILLSSVLGGGLGYVYQVLIGRQLAPSDYGLLASLLALFSVATVPLSAHAVALARVFALAHMQSRMADIAATYSDARIKGVGVALVSSLLFIVYYPWLERILKLEAGRATTLALFLTYFVASTQTIAPYAYLQGAQNYKWLGLNNVIGPALKIATSVLFVFAGFGIDGAVFGLTVTTLLIVLLNNHVYKKTVVNINVPGSVINISPRDFFTPFLATFAFIALTQFDLILVRILFGDAVAGIYSATATLGKVVMYLPGALTVTLLPMVVVSDAKGERSWILLLTALSVTLILAFLTVMFYVFCGGWVVRVLFGVRYAAAEHLLPYYSLAMVPMAVITVVEHYLLAKGKAVFCYVLLLILPLELLFLYKEHATPLVLIEVIGVGGLVAAFLGVLIASVLILNSPKNSATHEQQDC